MKAKLKGWHKCSGFPAAFNEAYQIGEYYYYADTGDFMRQAPPIPTIWRLHVSDAFANGGLWHHLDGPSWMDKNTLPKP